MTEDLLSQLNDSQREAVEYCDGASLVIASAGSGKTRVLTYKIAYLLSDKGMKPWNILALTFTNKAAKEMKERIGLLVGQEVAAYLHMGTFHSVFSRILRAEASTLGYNSNFTIYDQADARSLVKSICKEMGLDDKEYNPHSVSDRISMAKNHLVRPDAFVNSSLFDPKKPKVVEIYRKYAERCRQANAMDFDDLLVNTYLLFAQHEEVRRKYVDKYKYVLVDEYQDTNSVQQAIVLQLTREHQRVCVVGDDAQSIYGFRGANIDNILDFRQSYDNAKLFKLEQNYRSTQLIVQAANSLISKNARQIPKTAYSHNAEGDKVQLKLAYSDKEEALIVCNDILRLRRTEKLEWNDFAILYRTNSQSRSFEEYMRKQNIPYRIYGGLSFYQRKEIKDIIAYFRLVVNPNDEEALKRVINYPTRGIGATTLTKIINAATTYGVSLWAVVSQPVLFHVDLTKGTASKIEAFRQLIEDWTGRVASEDAYLLGHDIITQSGVSKEIYSSHDPEDVARQENLEEFLGGMQDFVESRREEGLGDQVSMSDFLQEVSLLTDLDSDGDANSPKVSLMTIHSAKGLEFHTVFVVGLEENIFPSPMCTNSMREIEEERRLLYVAITRAEKHCILTCAQNRFRFGRMEFDTPSRFIRDINPSLLHVDNQKDLADEPYARSQRTSWTQNPRPVATQFKADPIPRAVAPRREEPPVDPFSAQFKAQLAGAAAKKFKPVSSLNNRTMNTGSTSPSASSIRHDGLREGCLIEHQRFGVGKVLRIEGTGENEKATVEFRNVGTKQLLLKFAKFTILEK